MFTYSRGNDQFTRRLNDRLRTTGLGLGLLRLQFDAGLTEEAKSTLAALQKDFQILLHGLEGEVESQSAKPSTRVHKQPRPRLWGTTTSGSQPVCRLRKGRLLCVAYSRS